MECFLANGASRTLQAPASSSLQSATGIAAVSGYAVNDIVAISGCSQSPANRPWLVTAISGGQMSLVDLSGNAPNFTYAGTPTCTVTHLGFITAALNVDNTVLWDDDQDFTLRFRIDSLTAGTGLRVHLQDTSDAFATDARPVASWSFWGAIDQPHSQYDSRSLNRYDAQGVRLGNPGNALRALIYIEGASGVAAPAGAAVTYTGWIETN